MTVFYTEPVVKNQDDVAANFTAREAADFTMTSTKFGKKDYPVPSPKFPVSPRPR